MSRRKSKKRVGGGRKSKSNGGGRPSNKGGNVARKKGRKSGKRRGGGGGKPRRSSRRHSSYPRGSGGGGGGGFGDLLKTSAMAAGGLWAGNFAAGIVGAKVPTLAGPYAQMGLKVGLGVATYYGGRKMIGQRPALALAAGPIIGACLDLVANVVGAVTAARRPALAGYDDGFAGYNDQQPAYQLAGDEDNSVGEGEIYVGMPYVTPVAMN
ncbi:MAG: hypothetical protein ACREJD_05825 [Phycisphaerales bacterium]